MDAIKRGSTSLQRLKEVNVSAEKKPPSTAALFWQ